MKKRSDEELLLEMFGTHAVLLDALSRTTMSYMDEHPGVEVSDLLPIIEKFHKIVEGLARGK